MRSYTEIWLTEGEIIAAGKGGNPANPRTWLFIGSGAEGIQIEFAGKDRPLAEKIASMIEEHRR